MGGDEVTRDSPRGLDEGGDREQREERVRCQVERGGLVLCTRAVGHRQLVSQSYLPCIIGRPVESAAERARRRELASLSALGRWRRTETAQTLGLMMQWSQIPLSGTPSSPYLYKSARSDELSLAPSFLAEGAWSADCNSVSSR